ncbi:uncharacterized protein LOC111339818 isoform X2 [Stylophora pistillata]|uniref:Uncharacterized protein C17orf59-like n=1 Tax=Stylophora pistillata TaxID=50429 RepID=A0A2B4RPP7_STYPI|nr:uncharacterized protein LOC111339818 isoform X2 [Stylophora pistillata]PFX18235.1 Uncharacterized protein C17orf59-like [Stylophora pistillata]
MADSPPTSTPELAASTAEETAVQDSSVSTETVVRGTGLSVEQGIKEKECTNIQSADESRVTLEATDVKLVKDKVASGSGTAVDAYEEITKSEVTSLDDWEDVHQSCLSEIPPIDPNILNELEIRASDIAENLDHMLRTLGNSLKAMSQVSTDCLSAYNNCVDHVSEAVDVNIKSMYTLIARCEELNASLKPVQNLAEQVKEIKRTLDVFEAVCK